MWIALLDRRGGELGPAAGGEAERAAHDIDQRPDAEDDDEADDAPEHELAARRALGLVIGTVDKVLVDAIEEGDKRGRDEDGKEDGVDDVDNAGLIFFQEREIDALLGGGDKRGGRENSENEDGGETGDFFHS